MAADMNRVDASIARHIWQMVAVDGPQDVGAAQETRPNVARERMEGR
jgi:hypothetical protein